VESDHQDSTPVLIGAPPTRRNIRTQDELKTFLVRNFVSVPKTELHFSLNEVSFEIFTGSVLSEENSLAMFGFFGFNVDMAIYNDSFMKISASLGRVILSDKRVNTPAAFVNVINTATLTEGEQKNFLDFVMVQHNDSGDKAISASISRPKIHLLPSVVCAVKTFFVKPFARMENNLNEYSDLLKAPVDRTRNVAILLYDHLLGDQKGSTKRCLRVSGSDVMKWVEQLPGVDNEEEAFTLCSDLLKMKFITPDDSRERFFSDVPIGDAPTESARSVFHPDDDFMYVVRHVEKSRNQQHNPATKSHPVPTAKQNVVVQDANQSTPALSQKSEITEVNVKLQVFFGHS